MSSETPAKHLARLKIQHSAWTIRPSESGQGWSAQVWSRNTNRMLSVYAPTLPQLDAALLLADPKNGITP